MIPNGEWCIPEKAYIVFWTSIILLLIVRTIIEKRNKKK